MNLTSIDAVVSDLLRDGYSYESARDVFEQRFIRKALVECDGNITRASRKIGLHRNTVMNKRKAWRVMA